MSEAPVIVTLGNQADHAAAKNYVIWMHGLGADGNDFAPIVSQLGLPHDLSVEFIFPHAPKIPVTVNSGYLMRAWYDIKNMDSLEREIDTQGMHQSCEQITQLASQKAELVGWDKIVIAGFSQGGAIAAHLLEYIPQACAGILCLSSYALHQLQPKCAVVGVAGLVMHGDFDPIVPAALGSKLADNLTNAGLDVSQTNYPMAHQVCPQQLTAIGKWLTQIL